MGAPGAEERAERPLGGGALVRAGAPTDFCGWSPAGAGCAAVVVVGGTGGFRDEDKQLRDELLHAGRQLALRAASSLTNGCAIAHRRRSQSTGAQQRQTIQRSASSRYQPPLTRSRHTRTVSPFASSHSR